MKGSELRKIRELLNTTQDAAASSVGVSVRTWQRWEASKKSIPKIVARMFRFCVLCGGVLPLDYDHATCESCISAWKLL